MKVAVLICGMYRDFDIAIKSWSFMNHMDCDFYVSTWDSSRIINKKYGININHPITNKNINDFLPNAHIEIHNEKNFMDTFYLETLNDPIVYDKYVYHWKSALNNVIKSNKKYDVILITRFDNFFNYDTLLHNYEKNTIYISNFLTDPPSLRGDRLYVEDNFFIGEFDTIKTFIENMDNYTLDIHKDLVLLFNKLNYNVRNLNKVRTAIVRPNVRLLNPIDHTFDIIFHLDFNWRINWEDKHELEHPKYW